MSVTHPRLATVCAFTPSFGVLTTLRCVPSDMVRVTVVRAGTQAEVPLEGGKFQVWYKPDDSDRTESDHPQHLDRRAQDEMAPQRHNLRVYREDLRITYVPARVGVGALFPGDQVILRLSHNHVYQTGASVPIHSWFPTTPFRFQLPATTRVTGLRVKFRGHDAATTGLTLDLDRASKDALDELKMLVALSARIPHASILQISSIDGVDMDDRYDVAALVSNDELVVYLVAGAQPYTHAHAAPGDPNILHAGASAFAAAASAAEPAKEESEGKKSLRRR
jgi:hypothetical protein